MLREQTNMRPAEVKMALMVESNDKEPAPPSGPARVAGPAPTDGGGREEAEEEEGETDHDGVHSSPLVRRIAKEHGVDLSALAGKGTGVNGRITKSDILSYIEQGAATAGVPPKSGGAGPRFSGAGAAPKQPSE